MRHWAYSVICALILCVAAVQLTGCAAAIVAGGVAAGVTGYDLATRRECPHCKKIIKKSAEKCPHCGAEIPQPPPKAETK